MKKKLNAFFDRFSIKNKIIIACIPFLIISYLILFLSMTLIFYQQMKNMVYDQTQQNITEKTKLLNQIMDNYEQITTNYLYYTKEVQTYLQTDQSLLSSDELEKLNENMAMYTASLLTDNNPEIEKVMLYNEYNELYINNAIYANTLEEIENLSESIHEKAKDCHGKLIIMENPIRPQALILARTVYVPKLEQSNQEIGFLMLEISKSMLKTQMELQENSDSIYVILTDSEGNILINASELSNSECNEIIEAKENSRYIINKRELTYSSCRIISIIDEYKMFANTYKLFFIEIFIMGVSVLLILAAIVYSGSMISGQISRFIWKLNQTQEINQNAYIEVESNDEFRELGNVYNNMLKRIDNLIHTVYLKELLTKNAQLESLEAQINPHFLYNTLDCINSLVSLGEKDNVKKVVTSLANIMRMSIKGNTFIMVKEDISYIEQYIFIQKMRFQNKILFLVEVPISIRSYYIPKLTIQPLVENAVIHGVENLNETGMIGIFGREDDKNIYISVKDNGYGIPDEIINQLHEENIISGSIKSHIGLFNIQKKLQILFGKDYGIHIERLFPHGTCVTICIPKIKDLHGKEKINENIDR